MVDEVNAETMDDAAASGSGKRKNMIFVGILLGVMIVEGAAAFALVKYFQPSPAEATAGQTEGLDAGEGAKADQEIEVEVARIRAQNRKGRQTLMCEVTVFATISSADQAEFEEILGRKKAAISDHFCSVIRAAEPMVLEEPDAASLRQAFFKELVEIIGKPEMVHKVLIPEFVPLSAG